MKEAWPDNLRRVPLLLIFLAAAAHAAPPTDFEATLEVLRNGKLSGESQISYSSDGGLWAVSSHTRGVKGMARFMGLDERSTSTGTWVDGQPRPARFESKIKATLVDRGWSADYDWDEGVIKTVHEDGESTLELAPGVIDDSTVNLVIRLGLAQGETEWHLEVVDEDEIDDDRYRAHPPGRIDTALGCMEVVKVEKIRAPDSSRYTYTWFARDHGWAPVKLVHGKKGDSEIESRLKSLKVDGEPVAPAPACN
jgi:hypothetical protein